MDNKDILNWKQIPTQSKIYRYQVREDGKILKTSKKHFKESYASAYIKHGNLTVKIANKEYCVKHLVAQAFIPNYQKGDNIILKDSNIKNCHIDNLLKITKEELGKITGGESRRKAVIVDGKEYYSIRECARKLNCSYQTLLDYINGKVKNSVLEGKQIEYVRSDYN